MKITKEQYARILVAIGSLDKNMLLEHKALELGKDRTKRFVWDCFYAVGHSNPKTFAWVMQSLYTDDTITDTHIETALRKACKELGLL